MTRRTTFALIFALSAVVVALFYGIGSDRSSRTAVEPRRAAAGPAPGEAIEAQSSSSVDSELNDWTGFASPPPSGSDPKRDLTATRLHVRTDLTDENTYREQVKEEAAREVSERYSLLLEDLSLSPKQKNDLISLLIESLVSATTKGVVDRTSNTVTVVLRGKQMTEQERSKRIEAIIGYPKFQEFLGLERNLPAYKEAQNVASMLQANGVPLTETQRDMLLKQLVLTRDRYVTTPPPNVASIEDLERAVTERDEYERHVLELAPSVLSSKQVQYVSDQYQYLSERRARYLLALDERWRAVVTSESSDQLFALGGASGAQYRWRRSG